MSEPTVVHVVPHTHWDREWYQPFQVFRMRLVELIDRLLEGMEADERLAFTLDGQLAVVDDYVEIRPESEPRLRRLVEQGRLAIGPWQILMDEFLVSGETIVRSLEIGTKRGEELGGAMPVGYLPDMFGHVAQMPQILHRAGLAHAVVWRGVPVAVDRHAFVWEAPDGSAVRAEYLVGGYGNGAHLFDAPDRVAQKLAAFHDGVRPFFGEDEPLTMVGTDHMEPPPDLVDLVEQANGEQSRYVLEIETLSSYVAGVPRADDDLPRWQGELRSGARANMLMGVASARLDLKAACARAERLLERYAEPLQALYEPVWPEEYLRAAWTRVIQNSAHDSICGCSLDAVCDQVLGRFAEAEQIAAELARRAAQAGAGSAARGSVVVVNPSPHPRSGLVKVELTVPESWQEVAFALEDGTVAGTQETGRRKRLLFETTIAGEAIREWLARALHGRELYGLSLNGYQVHEDEGVHRLTLDVGEEPDPSSLDVDDLVLAIERATAVASDETWELVIQAEPRRMLLATVPAPALGWSALRPVPGSGWIEHPVEVSRRSLGNGLLEVRVVPNGTLRIVGGGDALEGAGRLVDGGDCGDSYNYAPPALDRLVDEAEDVTVEVVSPGRVRGELAVTRTYRWPLGLLADGSGRVEETALVPVITHLELRAGEPFLRLRVSFENRCADHRLRLHVPLAAPTGSSFAEGQFAVVERGREAEGGHGEVPLPTFPARGFVDAGGVAVLLDHVLEYELVEGRELSLTLLRATGLISRSAHPYRDEPAGPEIPTPAAQCRGPWSVAFALYPHAGSWLEAGVLEQMEKYQHPFLTAPGTGTGAPSRAGIELRGDGVVLSSLRRRGEWLELRIVCEQPEPRVAVVSGGFREAREADVLGRPGRPLHLVGGELRLQLGRWEIRTVQLKR